jgi:DoxX-like protein
METSRRNMKLVWTGRVISVLVSLLFVWSAGMKLMALPSVIEGMGHLGLPASLMMPLGVIELSCVVVYLIPETAVIGAILFTGYLGGAIVTHLRLGEPVYMQVLFGVLIWFGLWLRDPRLRKLIPWRKRLSAAAAWN